MAEFYIKGFPFKTGAALVTNFRKVNQDDVREFVTWATRIHDMCCDLHIKLTDAELQIAVMKKELEFLKVDGIGGGE